MKRHVLGAIGRRLTALAIAVLLIVPYYLLGLHHYFEHISTVCVP